MKENPDIIVVMPAYNAAKTLEKTFYDIPEKLRNNVVLGDDCSKDKTIEIAKKLGIGVIKTPKNLGYGGNQKMLYRTALKKGADIVVMLHPDWQYDATKIQELINPIVKGEKDIMLGSRVLSGGKETLAGGMPVWKYISNVFLTLCENLAFRLGLSEYHTGFRAYSRHALETVEFEKNSDDFVFDTELLARAARADLGVGEIAVPCRYFPEASSVNFFRSTVYGLQTLWVCLKYLLKLI
ncbi:MAG: b-glycosyltransferase [Candidatus Saganbacteria bacterium]|uniref:B-glycosyltransferase n=1 Tax=Candidatus Saganbacteria bacterium TaxID=2575572 RepID=A0A833P355_UNCSA|nr:MAG: b-glycosyltransferase [Candidatus Saganbacteria bacterium]